MNKIEMGALYTKPPEKPPENFNLYVVLILTVTRIISASKPQNEVHFNEERSRELDPQSETKREVGVMFAITAYNCTAEFCPVGI